jgi:hypothetical protein
MDSGLAPEPAPGRREAPIRVARPGMTAERLAPGNGIAAENNHTWAVYKS